MPVVFAVSVSPTCAVPVMVGSPVAGVLDAVTVAVGALVNDSSVPASSVKVIRTLTVFPSSAATRA